MADSSRPPASNFSPSSKVANCRRPGSSPGRQAPVTGSRSTTCGGAALGGGEAGVEVGQDVVDRLDAHREAHQVGGDPGGGLLVGHELLMGGGRRVDGE